MCAYKECQKPSTYAKVMDFRRLGHKIREISRYPELATSPSPDFTACPTSMSHSHSSRRVSLILASEALVQPRFDACPSRVRFSHEAPGPPSHLMFGVRSGFAVAAICHLRSELWPYKREACEISWVIWRNCHFHPFFNIVIILTSPKAP